MSLLLLKHEKMVRSVNLSMTKSFLSIRDIDEKLSRSDLSIAGSEQLRDQMEDAKDNHIDDELTLSNRDVLDALTLSNSQAGSPDRDAQRMLHSNLLKPLLGALAYKNFAPEANLAGLSYLVIDSFNTTRYADKASIIFAVEYDSKQLTLDVIADALDEIIASDDFQYGEFTSQVFVPLYNLPSATRDRLTKDGNVMVSDYTPKALQVNEYSHSPFDEFGVSDDEATDFARLPEHIDMTLTF